MYHGPHSGSKPPGGWPQPTGGPFQSSQAPFGAGNSTAGGATPTGTGMVTMKTTINLIPVPLTSSIPGAGQSPATIGAGGATANDTGMVTIKTTITLIPGPLTSFIPVAGQSSAMIGAAEVGGASGSQQSGSPGSPSGAPGPPGQAGNTCGPATVTVTTANTVTVTVQASPSPSPIESPQSSAPVQSPVFPYPKYNSSIPLGSTGTGSLLTSYVTPTPSSSPSASSSASPRSVQEASDGQLIVPATPIEAGVTATTSSLVAVKTDDHPSAAASKPSAPVVPTPASPSPVVPAPVVPTPASSSSVVPAPVVPTPASSSPISTVPSAPASSPSTSTGSSGSTGVKARGLLYSYNNQQLAPVDSLAQANAAVNDKVIGWMANWDSSPATGSGPARGSAKVEYVAQLWGTDTNHITNWQTNANTPWLMGFNEPDNCGGGGACLTLQEAASGHTAHIAPLRKGSTKVTTPCTQNNVGSPGVGSDYMAGFLARFPQNSFDAIAFHWYGPGTQEGLNRSDNPQSLAATVAEYQKLQKQYGIAELWITEGGPTDAASNMLTTFLEWLDDPSNGVDRYLWNGLNSPSSVVQVKTDMIYLSG
ncbi:MAG: hypothetical protein Q9175_002338 [Cornicularia normoerica]